MTTNDSNRKRISGHHEPERLNASPEPRKLNAHTDADDAEPVPAVTADVDETPAFVRYGAAVLLGLTFGVVCYVWFSLKGNRQERNTDRMVASTEQSSGLTPADFYLNNPSGQPVALETTSFGGNVDANGVFDADYFSDDLAGYESGRASAATEGRQMMAVYNPGQKVIYLFELNSTNVPENTTLTSMARNAARDGNAVDVKAYTDPSGSKAYNQRLSERRARAVRDYFAAHGVPVAKIKAQGMGPTDAYPTDDQNRRAEIVLVEL